MLKQRREKQQQMELVIMEQMVPENHFLRKVDRAVDFRPLTKSSQRSIFFKKTEKTKRKRRPSRRI